jgi:hypothetical protein
MERIKIKFTEKGKWMNEELENMEEHNMLHGK